LHGSLADRRGKMLDVGISGFGNSVRAYDGAPHGLAGERCSADMFVKAKCLAATTHIA